MRIHTGKGDDGTTGLLYGGRVPKDAPQPEACGAVDEAQAAIGAARAELGQDDAETAAVLLQIERDLYVLMAELATAPEKRHKLKAGITLVTAEMFNGVAEITDEWAATLDLGGDFVLPGDNRAAALLDVARTVVRRAERRCLAVATQDSVALPYLNRLSSLLWAAARRAEQQHTRAKVQSE